MDRSGTGRTLTGAATLLAALLVVAGCNLNDGLGAPMPVTEGGSADAPSGPQWDSVLGRSYLPLPPGAMVDSNPEPRDAAAPPSSGAAPSASLSSRSLSPARYSANSTGGEGPSLSPATLTLTLQVGESHLEHKTASIPGAPPRGDVLFAIDLTGSMAEELARVKDNSRDIMAAVNAIIPDTRYGVVSHMDYPETYGGCGYGLQPYGDAARGDYPYSLDRALTGDLASIETAISALALGYGVDGPESYARVLYESYADQGIGWQDGARRILLFWQDHIPHDCDPFLDGTQPTSGPDPGRDAVTGNADDLILEDVLKEMAANNITLIALHSSPSFAVWPSHSSPKTLFEYWQKYAAMTGGTAVRINPNGTVPDGAGSIAEFVADLILAEVSTIEGITLKARPPEYAEWLAFVTPGGDYTEVDLSSPWSGSFDILLTVPAGTPPGDYEFQIVLDGDGAAYAAQAVSISVLAANMPPVADAGPDQIAEQSSPEGAWVTLEGSGSSDPDGDTLSFAWSWPGGSASGVAPTVLLPPGTTVITLTVSDGALVDSDTVAVLVQDTTPPHLDLQVLADTLWPPNHKLVKVAMVSAGDIADPEPTVVIQVTHDQSPHDNQGAGDGHFEPDWQIDPDGGVWIRAERNGTGADRLYTITVTVTDHAGRTSTAAAAVTVPHDQGARKED